MQGKGHNTLRNHLAEIGDPLAQQGVWVIRGRQMWNGLQPANDGMHLAWGLPTVFRVLAPLKARANFLMLFCQFHG
eukprot:9430599-Alexandrium_andersonii.AAC.1